jgi:hypothetical protein
VQLKAHGSCKTWPTSQILMWENLGVAWEEEEDLCNISWENYHKKMQDTEHCF